MHPDEMLFSGGNMFELILECGLIVLIASGLGLLSYMFFYWASYAATDVSIDPVHFEHLCIQRLNKMQRRVHILRWVNATLCK
jgi:ABC-type antimicrobial peptide transport system permease subunit